MGRVVEERLARYKATGKYPRWRGWIAKCTQCRWRAPRKSLSKPCPKCGAKVEFAPHYGRRDSGEIVYLGTPTEEEVKRRDEVAGMRQNTLHTMGTSVHRGALHISFTLVQYHTSKYRTPVIQYHAKSRLPRLAGIFWYGTHQQIKFACYMVNTNG